MRNGNYEYVCLCVCVCERPTDREFNLNFKNIFSVFNIILKMYINFYHFKRKKIPVLGMRNVRKDKPSISGAVCYGNLLGKEKSFFVN